MTRQFLKYTKLAAITFVAAVSTQLANAQIVRDSVPELMQIDIIEHLGDRLPLELEFADDNGNPVTLGDYFGKDKPVLLALGYYECPMLCNLVFNGITEGVAELGWTPGKKFEIVTVSIEPTETPELAKAKKENYLKALNLNGAGNGWHFLVGEKSQSEALAEAVGFKYYYVDERQEWAHPAAVYLISPEGVISRYLYGIKFPGRDLKLGLLEASEGKIGSTIDRIILYCFHYDPDSKGYVLFAQNVMKLGGVLTIMVLSLFVGTLWFKDQMKSLQERRSEQKEGNKSGVEV